MAELQQFKDTIKDKSEKTQKNYIIQYNKLKKLFNNEDIGNISQSNLLSTIKEEKNINTVQSLINIAILIRRMHGLAVDKLIKAREDNKERVNENIKTTNKQLEDTLPSYDTLVEYTNNLYKENKHVEYLINFLLLNCFVRNEDLNFELVERKKDMTDKDMNYIWVDIRMKKCLYVRNNYKTSGTYGVKKNVIKDEQFFKTMKYLLTCIKKNYECKTIIPNDKQIGYYVKKATYQELGETKYMKISVLHFKNNLGKLKEISESRGTSLDTIITHYNLEKK